MKKFIIRLFCLFTIFSQSVFAEEKLELTIGTAANYPPFEFINKDNQIVGFEIDLIQAICAEINASCKMQNQPFDNLIPSLNAKRVDAIISAIDVTPTRKNQIGFSDIYYKNSAALLTLNNDINSLADLNKKRVGVENGSTHQQFLIKMHPKIEAVNYDSPINALLDMKNKRIDAVLVDSGVANELITQFPNLKKAGENITDEHFYNTGMAIAFKKNNKELQEKMNNGLKKIQENGNYETIYKKWFKE